MSFTFCNWIFHSDNGLFVWEWYIYGAVLEWLQFLVFKNKTKKRFRISAGTTYFCQIRVCVHMYFVFISTYLYDMYNRQYGTHALCTAQWLQGRQYGTHALCTAQWLQGRRDRHTSMLTVWMLFTVAFTQNVMSDFLNRFWF